MFRSAGEPTLQPNLRETIGRCTLHAFTYLRAMEFTYQLTKEDYLAYYMHSAETSPMIQKRLKIAKWSVPIMQLAIAIFYIFRGMYIGAGVLFLLGILWYFFYPRLLDRRYKKFYNQHIEQNHSHEFSRTLKADVDLDRIIVNDGANEAKAVMDEVDQFIELEGQYVFVLKNRSGIIIPKTAEGNLEELAATFKTN